MDEKTKEILETEFSETFTDGMKERMAISFYKYGPVRESQGKINYITSLRDRLKMYADTGNTEYLMDAANFAMIEFMFPRHPDAFFKATDDDGSPGRISTKTGARDKRPNHQIGTKAGVTKTGQFR